MRNVVKMSEMFFFSFSTVESSPLLKNSKFLKRETPESGVDSDPLNSMEEVLFRDYLKQQIDHLMTGDAGRDGVAEGRRGTHVEVCCTLLTLPSPLPLFLPLCFSVLSEMSASIIDSCHRSGSGQGKKEFLNVREKSENFTLRDRLTL